jgi:hypothetical protein
LKIFFFVIKKKFKAFAVWIAGRQYILADRFEKAAFIWKIENNFVHLPSVVPNKFCGFVESCPTQCRMGLSVAKCGMGLGKTR